MLDKGFSMRKVAVEIIADAFYNCNLESLEADREAIRLVTALDRAGYKIVDKEDK